MSTFNFYINVDECLNMSNFDMFFYKLQYENQFYVVDASLNNTDNSGLSKRDIGSALNEIKDYIGPRLFQDYRLVFGIRQKYKKNEDCSWQETVLYKLLKIYYNLQSAGIYIKTKDPVDKNVTVILLYDVKNTFDEKEIKDEINDHTQDIPKLLSFLNVDWKEETDAFKVSDAASKMEEAAQHCRDDITKLFITEYCKWLSSDPLDKVSDEDSNPLSRDLMTKNRRTSSYPDESLIYNRMYELVTFVDNLIGQYCVFTKSVSSNAGAHRLALLSIVDYITTGLTDEKNSPKEYTNASLKQKATENWANAKNNEEIRKKYGSMIQRYENRLKNKFVSLEGRTAPIDSKLAIEIEDPKEISNELFDKGYEEIISTSVDHFNNKFVYTKGRNKDLEYVDSELKTLIGNMKESLQEYSQKLISQYRHDFQKRREDRKFKGKDDGIYDLKLIEEKINEAQGRKEELLEELEKEQMNPSIHFQDQINADNAIRMFGDQMRYYHRRKKQISFLGFLLLILIAGGFVVIHHLLLQGSQITEAVRAASLAASIGTAFLLFLISYRLPSSYYAGKMKECLDKLRNELREYSHGYTERAKNFKKYINIINRIDAMNLYLDELEDMKERAYCENRRILWHKERIESHIKKCSFFQLLYVNDLLPGVEAADVDLDIHKDVIHNPLYWPQEQFGDR